MPPPPLPRYIIDDHPVVLVMAPGFAAVPAAAETEGRNIRNPLGSQLAALDTQALDDIRGGFELADSNLRFSFGIERAVYINGELMTTTVLNLKEVQGAGGNGSLPANAGAALNLVQNGAGNSVATAIGPNLLGTIIQNSLDGQKIQNVTTINASVNSAQILRNMFMQWAIRDGIVGSLRR